MTVQEIVSALSLEVFAGADHLSSSVTVGYASDLLSCVLAGASDGSVWVTLQAHVNVVAVAALLNLSCVIVTEGRRPNQECQVKANENGIPILLSNESTFTVVSQLVQLGIGSCK